MGGQGGCELRSEAFVKIQQKIFFLRGGGGSGWGRGGQGGCEWRSEAFVKIQKKGGGGGGLGQGVALRGGGVRVDGNREVKLV